VGQFKLATFRKAGCAIRWSTVFEQSSLGPTPLSIGVKFVLTLWYIILVEWLPLFTLMGTGMAFEGGHIFRGYLFNSDRVGISGAYRCGLLLQKKE